MLIKFLHETKNDLTGKSTRVRIICYLRSRNDVRVTNIFSVLQPPIPFFVHCITLRSQTK